MMPCQWNRLKVIHSNICLFIYNVFRKLVWKQFESLKLLKYIILPLFHFALRQHNAIQYIAISCHVFISFLIAKPICLCINFSLWVYFSNLTHLFCSQDKWVDRAWFVLVFILSFTHCTAHCSVYPRKDLLSKLCFVMTSPRTKSIKDKLLLFPTPTPTLSSFSSHPPPPPLPVAIFLSTYRAFSPQSTAWSMNTEKQTSA